MNKLDLHNNLQQINYNTHLLNIFNIFQIVFIKIEINVSENNI
jgi:hypothetical protein